MFSYPNHPLARPLFILFLICVLQLAVPVRGYAVPFISKEYDVELGKDADKQVIKRYGLYQDKSLQLYVNEVGQKLVSSLSDQMFPKYFFKVVDSPEINAFALPGGYIYVTRGILALFNSEAELAGVLGHEIGHVIKRHGAKNIVRSIGAAVLAVGAAVANPEQAGRALTVTSQMFNQINLGYGREAEMDSDAQGMMNSFESGYNPKGMVGFLRSLRRNELFTGQGYHAFAASHPETKERVLKADLFASSLVARGGKLELGRKAYLEKIQGLPYRGRKSQKDRKVYKKKHIDIYEVKAGDTLTSIAEQELEDETKDFEIAALNGMRMRDKLEAGEWLKVVREGEFKKEKTLVIKPEKFQ